MNTQKPGPINRIACTRGHSQVIYSSICQLSTRSTCSSGMHSMLGRAVRAQTTGGADFLLITCVSNLAEAIVKAIGSVSLVDARASISSHPKLVLLACLLRGTTSPEPDREMGEVMMPFVLAVAACRGCVVVVYARVQYCIGPRYKCLTYYGPLIPIMAHLP